MINFDELPLFPLYTVLYTDMPLPLHIFEPRYLEMMEHCRAYGGRFGVVLIQSGAEVGDPAVPFSVGTIARITQSETLPNGHLNVLVTGEERFSIVDIVQHRSFLTARVEVLAEERGDQITLDMAHEGAADLFRTYLRRLYALANRHISSLQIPTDPVELSYAIANAVQIPLIEKQRLLEYDSAQARLEREIDILKSEVDAQEFLCRVHAKLPNRTSWEISPINTDELRQLTSRN
jgi:Lon protease-like protein